MVTGSNELQRSIDSAVGLIRDSQYVVALTGAGISTPSGIPDFRSVGSGLWTKNNPFDVASITGFKNNPERFYKWVHPLAIQIRKANPNPAHIGLSRLEQSGYIQTIVTQNIDLLHQRAGSSNVLEVHGSWSSMSCIDCSNQVKSDRFIEPFLEKKSVPRCPVCRSIMKPDLILMGEQLPVHTWLKVEKASIKCSLMIVAGSSLEVHPVAGLPSRAKNNGARLIVINQSETYIDARADVVFNEDVVDVIPELANQVIGDG